MGRVHWLGRTVPLLLAVMMPTAARAQAADSVVLTTVDRTVPVTGWTATATTENGAKVDVLQHASTSLTVTVSTLPDRDCISFLHDKAGAAGATVEHAPAYLTAASPDSFAPVVVHVGADTFACQRWDGSLALVAKVTGDLDKGTAALTELFTRMRGSSPGSSYARTGGTLGRTDAPELRDLPTWYIEHDELYRLDTPRVNIHVAHFDNDNSCAHEYKTRVPAATPIESTFLPPRFDPHVFGSGNETYVFLLETETGHENYTLDGMQYRGAANVWSFALGATTSY